MTRIRLVFFLVLLSGFTFGQKYTFISYSTGEGLPQSQVSSIVQDSMGYLWVGTLGGLARFNGEEFESYSVQNGLVNNRITHLELINNELWIGHDGGVSKYVNGKFTKYVFNGQDKSRNVSDIIKFKEQIYVCSNGGGLFKLKDNQLIAIELPNSDHVRIRQAVVENDQLLLATRDGVLVSKNGQDFNLDSRFDRFSYSGISINGMTIHLTTYTDGYFTFNKITKELKNIPFEEFGMSLYGAYADNTGKMWFVTQEGIVLADASGKLKRIDSRNGLPAEMISCFYQDRDGTIWVGSQGKGFFRFAGDLFVYYDRENGWQSDLFLCGFEKQNGELFVGSYDSGLIKRSSDGTIQNIPIEETTIWSAVADVDNMDWFGAQAGLVGVNSNGDRLRLTAENGLPGNKIASLFRIDDSKMFIGGNEGVALYESGNLRRYNKSDKEFIGTVRDFCLVKGKVYCVSNLGVFVLENESFNPIRDDRQVVYNIETDQYNSIWYGTEEGLFRIDKNGTSKIRLLDDPGSNFINFLNFHKGQMFVGTNNGLFILSNLSSEFPSYTHYGITEGIVDLETNLNSSFFDRDGNFWFGTAKGLVRYDLNKKKSSVTPPYIRLINVLVNYNDTDLAKYASSFDAFEMPLSLVLPYNKNNLVLEFDAVSLSNHRDVRFQYKLEGLNDEWSPLTEVATITFTSLPAGTFDLHVRAVDIDGNFSNTFIIPLRIKEAFYKTWWFLFIMVVLISLIVYSIFKLRIRRIRESGERDRLEDKARLLDLEQKSVNASMNRHFIFNALNSIQYFINTQDRRSANKYLTNFAQLIRKNLDSANSETNLITLKEELDRIKLYLSLEEMRFTDKFKSEILVKDIDPENVMIPAMILQPFVENAIIHGLLPAQRNDGLIKIEVTCDEEYVNIRIEDNGIGIQKSLSEKTLADGDHKSQGMEITTKRIEILKSISEINIELEGPKELKDEDGLIKGTYVLLKIPQTFLDY